MPNKQLQDKNVSKIEKLFQQTNITHKVVISVQP